MLVSEGGQIGRQPNTVGVLILILLDVSLGEFRRNAEFAQNLRSLNPYSTGC